MKLLPDDFDEQVQIAIDHFWNTKLKKASTAQAGTRGSVLSGKHMSGFTNLFIAVAKLAGASTDSIVTTGPFLTLPGYFRATKNWDGIILHEGKLVAAMEFKSQVGSFGNNQNNRIEEVVGLGHDFWTTERHGLFGADTSSGTSDPRPPFLGYMMLLEDRAESRKEMNPKTKTFSIDKEFSAASYADRYLITANRLISERLFDSVAIMLSPRPTIKAASYSSLSEPTNIRSLFQAFAAHVASVME